MHANALKALLATISLLWLLFAPCQANAATDDAVFEIGEAMPATYKRFAQVFGAQTEQGALLTFACMHKRHPALALGLFAIPAEGAFRPRHKYSIVVASYATKAEADSAIEAAKKVIDYAAVYKCLGLTVASGGEIEELRKNNAFVFDLDVPIQRWPKAIARTALAPFDGIGFERSRTSGVAVKAVIEPVAYVDQQAIAANIQMLTALHPDVHFAAVQHGSYFYLAAASFVERPVLDEAQLALRRRGLYRLAYRTELQPSIETMMTQSTAEAWNLTNQKISIASPALETNKQEVSVASIEGPDLIEPLAQRVQRCYSDGQGDSAAADPAHPATAAQNQMPERLAACAGVVLTPSSLTRCLLGADCIGMRVPIGFDLDPVQRLKDCLAHRDQAGVCQGLTVDPALASMLSEAEAVKCLASGAVADCRVVRAAMARVCDSPENKKVCSSNQLFMRSLPQRLDAVLSCLHQNQCADVVPIPTGIQARARAEIARLGMALNQPIPILPSAMAFLDGDTAAQVNRFQACLKLREDKKTQEAEACFVNMALHDDERQMIECLRDANDDTARVACFANDPKVTNALAAVDCIKTNGTGAGGIAKCMGGSEAAQVRQAVACVQKSPDAMEAALNCTKAIPAEVSAAIGCARNAKTSSEMLACLPVSDPRAKAGICVTSATTDEQRMACAANAVNLDPQALAAIQCVRGAGNAEAMLACVPVSDAKVRAATCLAAATTDSARFECAAGAINVDPQVTSAIACASNAGSNEALVACLPVSDKRARAALCMAAAETDSTRLACAAGAIDIDHKTAAMLGCLANSNGNNGAMAACAVGQYLSPEVATAVECATSSSGGVSFALCAAGPAMNPELRIAVDCAVSTGGNPIGTAGCTAGRLTIRELGKCMSGQIGREGGCFGPNNSIVKAFSTVGHDLTHGLGPNNDIVKAVGAIGNAVNEIAKGVANGIEQLGKALSPAGLKNAVCGVFGC